MLPPFRYAARVPANTAFLPLASGFGDLVGYHRRLLDDETRTRAFLRAIAKVVRPGDVVADLGAGTGILSFAARRAGAARVYAIERGPIARVGEAIGRENGVDEVVWLEKHSRDVVLREEVDVIVSECLGVLGAGGTMMQAVADLRARHLRPGGAVVPNAVSIFAAPVESPRDHWWVEAWSKRRYGLSWGAAAELARNNMYNTVVEPRALLAPAASITTIDLSRGTFDGRFHGGAETPARRAGTIHGFAAWFEAELAPGVRLATGPGKKPTVWRQVFLPLEAPLRVRRGEPVRFELTMTPAPSPADVAYVDWSGEVAGSAFTRSTRWTYPSPRSSMASPRAERKPLRARS